MVLGIDIGNTNIKILEMHISRKHCTITKVVQAPCPSEKNHTPDLIHELLKKHNIKTKKVVTTLATQSEMRRYQKLPHLKIFLPPKYKKRPTICQPIQKYLASQKEKQLRKLLATEVSFCVPYEEKDYRWDYSIETSSSLVDSNHVLLVITAVRNSAIQEQLSFLKKSSLQPIMITSQYEAIANALATSPSSTISNKKNIAVVDIGSSFTKVTILVDKIPLYCRGRIESGDTFTHAIAKSLNINFHQAEKIKKQPQTRDPVKSILQDVAKNLVNEVDLYIHHFNRMFDTKVECVLLCGGGSMLIGLSKIFKEELQIDVIPWSPIENYQENNNLKIEKYSFALTAAMLTQFLPTFSTSKKQINLLSV